MGDQSVAEPTNIPIFLSFSKPVFPAQHEFIDNLSKGLESFNLKPRTLGVTYYDTDPPLTAIKNMISQSAGLISIAFRRTRILEAEKYEISEGRVVKKEAIRDKWLTTPWPHIEVGMAFQIDVPVLILREADVVADGVLEKGSSAFYLPTFDLESNAQSYLFSEEWQHIFHKFFRQVQECYEKKKASFSQVHTLQPWPRPSMLSSRTSYVRPSPADWTRTHSTPAMGTTSTPEEEYINPTILRQMKLESFDKTNANSSTIGRPLYDSLGGDPMSSREPVLGQYTPSLTQSLFAGAPSIRDNGNPFKKYAVPPQNSSFTGPLSNAAPRSVGVQKPAFTGSHLLPTSNVAIRGTMARIPSKPEQIPEIDWDAARAMQNFKHEATKAAINDLKC